MRRFIAAQPLAAPVSAPDVHRVPARGAGAHYYTFEIEYGAPEGCGSRCNPSYASGVAVSCDHIGWYRITDNTDGRPAKPTMFEVRPTDTILFDDRLWPDAVSPELLFWLADDPRVPPAVREKARAHQPEIYF